MELMGRQVAGYRILGFFRPSSLVIGHRFFSFVLRRWHTASFLSSLVFPTLGGLRTNWFFLSSFVVGHWRWAHSDARSDQRPSQATDVAPRRCGLDRLSGLVFIVGLSSPFGGQIGSFLSSFVIGRPPSLKLRWARSFFQSSI
jgi:hypothetical protein